jgi:hypothetical protein
VLLGGRLTADLIGEAEDLAIFFLRLQGMVDEQFQQLQMLQDDGSSPGFIAEVVTLFCDDGQDHH